MLPAGEFVLGPPEGFHGLLDVALLDSDGVEDGADLDSGDFAYGFSEGSSHTGLESICASAAQHLVNSEAVPGVDSAAHVEVVLAHVLGEVLVGGHTGGFQSLRRYLLSLLRHDVDHEGEGVNWSSLPSDVVDPDLGVGHTSIVSRFRVRLTPAEPIAPGWSSAHL